tara:strand:+ start:2373 stop:2888 length:516 start_codon:yes stop_codon:yes gene_type:complete
MKHLLIILALFVGNVFSNKIIEREFVPLETLGMTNASSYQTDFVSDEDFEYAAWRCLSLTMAARNNWLTPESKKDKEVIKFFSVEEIRDVALKVAQASFYGTKKDIKGSNKNENPFLEEAKNLTTYLTQRYYNIMLTDFEKVGSYFDSDFMKGDIDACGSFLLVAQKILKE